MGYTTYFNGELLFKKELTASQIVKLNKVLGKDERELDFDFKESDEYWCWIDLEFNENFTALRHNGSEKTYGMVDMINTITKYMRKEDKDFELIGELEAKGEDSGDVWSLYMEDGVAKRREKVIIDESNLLTNEEIENILIAINTHVDEINDAVDYSEIIKKLENMKNE